MLATIFNSVFDRWPALPYVMFGIFYAWLDLMSFSPLVFSASPAAQDLRFLFLWVFFGAAVLCNFLVIVFHGRVRWLVGKPVGALLPAACLSVCTLLCLAASAVPWGATLVVVAAVLGAWGQTGITILLVTRFVELSGYEVFINIALFRILAAALYFIISGMPTALGIALLVVLPLCLFVTTRFSAKHAAPTLRAENGGAASAASGSAAVVSGNKAAMTRILIACSALVFVINAAGFGGPKYWGHVELLCIAFALVLIVILVYRSTKRTRVLSYWFYVAIAAVLLAFTLAAVLPVSAPFNYLVCGSFRSVFDAFYLGFLVLIARRSGLPCIKLTGIFYGCYLSAVILGLVVDTFVKSIASLTAYTVGATIFAMLTLGFLLFTFTPNDLQLLLGISVEAHNKRPEPHAATPPDPNIATLLSAGKGLSPREQEVLELLLQGNTAKMISAHLVVSASTTKTHVHNIYTKLGVHSREELLTLAKAVQVPNR